MGDIPQVRLVVGALLAGLLPFNLPLVAQDRPEPASLLAVDERIATPQQVEHAEHPPALVPIRIISSPFNLLFHGMEKGLISFEKHRIRERINLHQAYLREHGIAALVGGMGEGSGMGLGATYTVKIGKQPTLQFLGRASFVGYQEFGIQWSSPVKKSQLVLEASYQWRPKENFYGLGQESLKDQRTNFALRQTWAGVRWEVRPIPRIHLGTEYRAAVLSSGPGKNSQYASPDMYFPGLPGYGTETRLQTAGAYCTLDGFQGEYRLGGSVHLGASYQGGLARSNLDYFSYEVRAEGRLPMASGRSVLVGDTNLELNRLRGGSDPIPFYILPHIGGSSTMRGFALDRFYGTNILIASLEYRYRFHPNFVGLLFFDEGQIFDRTSDLSLLNWRRNYGLGFRMLSARGIFMRVEFGWSEDEGSRIHISFGDRERRPLGGPIRYGTYRR